VGGYNLKRYIGELFKFENNYKKTSAFLIAFAKKMTKPSLCLLVICLTMLITASARDGGKERLEMSFKAEMSGDRLTLTQTVSDALLCGYIGELEYDHTAFSFLGAEKNRAEGDNFCLSYAEKDGKVRFLLDSDENVGESGEIVSFCFEYLGDEDGMFAFSVYPIDDAYFFDGKELAPIEVAPFGVAVKCKAEKNDSVLPSVELTEALVTETNALRLSCVSRGFDLSFCGLSVSVVDLDGQVIVRYYLTKALFPFSNETTADGSRDFCFELDIPTGNASVIVTPLVYDRCGERLGESKVYYFSDAELIEY
jgi:hypothetical protein